MDPARSLATLLFTALGGIGIPIQALGTKLLVDAISHRQYTTAYVAASVVAFGLAAAIGAAYMSALISMGLEFRIDHELDKRVTRPVAWLPGVAHFESALFGSRMTRFNEQRHALLQAVAPLFQTASGVLGLAGSLLLLGRISPWLALLPLSGIPSAVAIAFTEGSYQRAMRRTAEERRVGEQLLMLGTSSRSAQEIRVYGLEDELLSRYTAAQQSRYRLEDRNLYVRLALQIPGLALTGVGLGAALLFTTSRAAHGQATTGDIFLVTYMLLAIVMQILLLGNSVGQATRLLGAAAQLSWILEYARRQPSGRGSNVPGRLARGITVDRVGFTYQGGSEPALHGVTAELRAGTTVALVGDNGAGKTTLVKLLARLYEPTEGQVLIDGEPLSDLDLEGWRRRLSAGFQDFVRFQFSARDAVGLGDVGRLDEEAAVLRALDRAGAASLVDDLMSGLDTPLGESLPGGVDLSGGQWQKLALGRAMMRESPLLLILDEPTASLDAPTEHALFEHYIRAARDLAETCGTITVLVSHRFSTVRMADQILVFSGGRLVESGSHEQLIRHGGLYREMYETQARSYVGVAAEELVGPPA